MIEYHRAAHCERAGGSGQIDLGFEFGQSRFLVLLPEFSGGIGIVLGAIHAAKVRSWRGEGHPARTTCRAQAGLARACRKECTQVWWTGGQECLFRQSVRGARSQADKYF